jgi:lysophospholipase L1-like esterase
LARFYALDRNQFDLQKPNQHVLTLCERHGIQCLDSLPALRQWYEAHGEPVFRTRGDMHFNERGQQVVAESLAAYLRAQQAQALRLSPE